jgi:hypothetical protein
MWSSRRMRCRRAPSRCGTRPRTSRTVGGTGRGVAVAGWQWYQSKEESSAVRMVVVRGWQWQYWLSCGSLKMGSKKNTKNSKMEVSGYQCGSSDLRSGSGGVGVEPIERGEQGGSNGGG